MKKFSNPNFFCNRENSWLAFNERVLSESQNLAHPLLDRLRFLAIASSNLDEFFMVRVGGLLENSLYKVASKDISGHTVDEQLKSISQIVHRFTLRQTQFWRKILPQLEEKGIEIKNPLNLSPAQNKWLEDYFHSTVLPTLTPIGIDMHHSFPFLLNKSLNLAVLLDKRNEKKKKNSQRVAIIQLPVLLPRLIPLPCGKERAEFFLLENLIKRHCHHLFRGHDILDITEFRITRNADFSVDDDDVKDLLEEMKKFLFQRSHGHTVRLEINSDTSKKLSDFLMETLKIKEPQVYRTDGPLDMTFLNGLANHSDFSELRYPALHPYARIPIDSKLSIFKQIREKDLLLHHPYDSFDPVIAFVEQAANDPHVLAIKQTIYRVGQDPRLINALIQAAHKGKQVTVLLEVKARFDEENNIFRAKQLEEAGCHVVYGLPGLKTHGKMILVVRQEKDGIRRYLHLGTGNYNPDTAKVYSDLGLFTCNPAFGEDATDLFNVLSGYSESPKWNAFAVAPFNLRKKLMQLIKREIKEAKAGNPARIIAKMNSLFDKAIVQKLYEASEAGVQVDLIIRGICTLKSEIPEVSDNIRVRSIIGRFLEHHRIFYFENCGEPEVFLSSADWMYRNLDNRVEIMFPIWSSEAKSRIFDILAGCLADTAGAYTLRKNGTYRKREIRPEFQFNFQQTLTQSQWTDKTLPPITRKIIK